MVNLNENGAKLKLTGVIVGFSVSLVLFFSATIVVGVMINFINIASLTTDKIMVGINYAVVFIGGLIAAYHSQSRGWLNGALSGLIYCLLLILLGSLFTTLSFSGGLLLRVLIACLVSALGGMIGINMI
ncbi:MAG: TIGR04086 family membrane protein [Bacillota bacterium]